MAYSSEEHNHFGFIRSIDHNILEIGVEAPIACTACELSVSCSISDKEEKIIHIKSDQGPFSIGEKVELLYEEKLSTKALLLVYIFPLIVLFAIISITNKFTSSELFIGLVSLGSLAFYFSLFIVFHKQINKVFYFTILKIDEGKELNQMEVL